MEKVVAPVAFGTSLHISEGSKAASRPKRKTPSELRGEQLKRTTFVDQAKEAFDALRPCTRDETENGLKKQKLSKNPTYIEMRMDELYPVKKAMPWRLSGKENSKENAVKQSCSLANVSLLSNVAANKRQLIREGKNASIDVSDDIKAESCKTNENDSQSIFRSVTELSTRGEEISCLPDIDMNKALKGLATFEPLPVHPGDISGKSDTASLSENFRPEFQVSGQKIPLDLSMKTYVRLVSSSPLNWLHRSMIMDSTYNGMPHLKSLSCNNTSSYGSDVVAQVLNPMSLHSWVYPQSTLPPFIISSLVASGSDKGEVDFLQKRKLEWEVAFRSLYFMFRKNHCNMFYVYTSQFVALFIGSYESGDVKRSCNAYITQSTTRLRAMLQDFDICYSMPLCKTKIDQITSEDLAELSEIENHNIGRIRRSRSASNIDNTPESLLAFVGNERVHVLYGLLLNYRDAFKFLPAEDVPVLYAPVPFQNAALSSPEFKGSEMARTNNTSCSMVEIKGEYLPPWIISNICSHVVANGQNFEASFVSEPNSVNLNIGLPQDPKTKDPAESPAYDDAPCISGAVICPQLQSGYLKSLKYCNNSYMVSLSPS